MRDILFRGKLLDTGEWVEGYVVKGLWMYILTAENIHYMSVSVSGTASVEVLTVNPKTVGQYTGLTDVNKQRIFEGDIVQPALPANAARRGFVWPKMPVVFRNGMFGLLDHRDEEAPFASFAPSVTFEVMGNIHDNPDLLKEE